VLITAVTQDAYYLLFLLKEAKMLTAHKRNNLLKF